MSDLLFVLGLDCLLEVKRGGGRKGGQNRSEWVPVPKSFRKRFEGMMVYFIR